MSVETFSTLRQKVAEIENVATPLRARLSILDTELAAVRSQLATYETMIAELNSREQVLMEQLEEVRARRQEITATPPEEHTCEPAKTAFCAPVTAVVTEAAQDPSVADAQPGRGQETAKLVRDGVQPPLHQVVMAVIARAEWPMTTTEITVGVEATGYISNARRLEDSVSSCLTKLVGQGRLSRENKLYELSPAERATTIARNAHTAVDETIVIES